MDELLPASAFAEAEDMNTTSERLSELAHSIALQPLIAANPAAPAVVLEQLSTSTDVRIRRAVAQNPNTPVAALGTLASEFPQEFLSNPIIPILNMTNPGFIKNLPLLAWASLLRFEKLPSSWLQQIKTDRYYPRYHPQIWKLIQLHVTLTDQTSRPWRAEADSELATYRKNVAQSSSKLTADEIDTFILFISLFPDSASMLKKQWKQAARIQPHLTAAALTSCRALGGKTFKLLLTENNIFVRCQIARHPDTPVKILAELSVHKRSEIRRAVASNPHTPAENITLLMADLEPAVRRAALTHPALAHANYEILLHDKDASVRAALAMQPRLDHALLTQLASDPDARVRAASARNSTIPEEILTLLAFDPASSVRAAAASNPRLALEAQSILLDDPEEDVRASLSGNARLLEHSVIQLAQDLSAKVRTYLAANPRVPIALLEQVMDIRREEKIWSGLARHPQASPELLTHMAQAQDMHVRALVAAHKRTPEAVLQSLASQNMRELWYGLVANPLAPLDILERALTTPYTELWQRIFNHPVMARHQQRPLLDLLIRKIQPQIVRGDLRNWLRKAVLQYHTALPAPLIESFASSPYWEERYLAANHPHISASLLDTLAQDGIGYVRAASLDADRQYSG